MAPKEGLWWPDVHVDEYMRIPKSHWYYRPQPAEFLLGRRLLKYADLFDHPDLYGPASMLRVIEAFGLDLPSYVKARQDIDNIENPSHDVDALLQARMARGMRIKGTAAVPSWQGFKYVPGEVEVQTSYIRHPNIRPGFNTNGPTIIPDRADFSVDAIYRDPVMIEVEGDENIVYTEMTLNTHYLEEGERYRQGWYVVVLPQTGGAVVTSLSGNAQASQYRVSGG